MKDCNRVRECVFQCGILLAKILQVLNFTICKAVNNLKIHNLNYLNKLASLGIRIVTELCTLYSCLNALCAKRFKQACKLCYHNCCNKGAHSGECIWEGVQRKKYFLDALASLGAILESN